VAHSRSPAIHARAFQLLGVDAVYAPCQVRDADLPAAVRGLRALSVAGANVTVPHKVSIMGHLVRVSRQAERVGAVNCIVNRDGVFEGHNTDIIGLQHAFEAAGITHPMLMKAVVIGAGGSARAAVSALSSCTIVNRSRARADELAREFHVSAGGMDALSESMLVVNCTPVGMQDDQMPFDPKTLPDQCTLVDLVYAGPTGETALVRKARERGVRVIDGIEILVRQAIASLELWLGGGELGHLYSALREAALS
jgi:shikimate dehydrogenase